MNGQRVPRGADLMLLESVLGAGKTVSEPESSTSLAGRGSRGPQAERLTTGEGMAGGW